MINGQVQNKIKTLFLLICLFWVTLDTASQNYYWVGFTDKNDVPYSLQEPDEYLSDRAILRRVRQGIPIDSFDLPVNRDYIFRVLEQGASLVHASRWLNGVTVKSEAEDFHSIVSMLPFVREVQLTKPGEANKSAVDKFYDSEAKQDVPLEIDTSYYGTSSYQVAQLNAHYLHNLGYRGDGMVIAVLDAGYYNANIYSAFDSLWHQNRVLGTKDFVDPTSDIFSTNYHGMSVLSCMAGIVPGQLIGTAPDALYWLLRSEDSGSEYLIEEDHWVVAAEFADSIGADIINSSLGYYHFDDPSMNHVYADMDGQTTRVTIGADIAASRGMMVFSSVGNEGNDAWKFLIAPSDGDGVIAVGAVDREGSAASFTSYGPAADGDVKPNVAALGRNTFLQKSDGTLGFSNGTSYACPVMAGAAACLWQANPSATVLEVKNAIEQSAHLYPLADSLLGFGIPDMKTADLILKSAIMPDSLPGWNVYPNPFYNQLVLFNNDLTGVSDVVVSMYTVDGKLQQRIKVKSSGEITISGLQGLPAGLLILKIESEHGSESLKVTKIR